MKKLLNDPAAFVDEMLEGILLAHPDRLKAVGEDRRSIVRADAPVAGHVGIVTGGGSGHLPVFLGFVGVGLCSGVAVGNVFSSPSMDQILEATRGVDGGAGVLYLFGNYGGDVLNFELAAELADAEGITTATVLVADDVASAPAERADTRRGVAGLFFAYKCAGAVAEAGGTLEDVAEAARHALEGTRSMGVGLSPTILPAAGKPTFELDDGEMEIGIGIHGEPGVRRGPLETADEVADDLLGAIAEDLRLVRGERVAVLVNGLGATPLEELYIVYRRVHGGLAGLGVEVARTYVGEYATSLEMAGASLTVIRVDERILGWLDAPAFSPFFRVVTGDELRLLLIAALPRVAEARDELRDLDAAIGDGDLGVTVGDGALATAAALADLPPDTTPAAVLKTVGMTLARANPSTFSALAMGALLAASKELGTEPTVGYESGLRAARAAAESIATRGKSAVGDKTVLDALVPSLDAAAAAPDAPLAGGDHGRPGRRRADPRPRLAARARGLGRGADRRSRGRWRDRLGTGPRSDRGRARREPA